MIMNPDGRGPTSRQLAGAGISMVLTVALLLGLLSLRYTGQFESKIPVTAVLTSTGDGLPNHADVKFRGMVVGAVDDVEVVGKGERQNVRLQLKPAVAPMIPDTVTARVIPNSIFGVTAVELVDNGISATGLHTGATISEDTSTATVQLQTTLNVLRSVLNNIQPEKLGRVLATLATALDPTVRVPGSTVERLDTWLTEVQAIPDIGSLLGDLGRATTALSQSAPELVGMLSASVTTARTLTEERANLIALLTNGGSAVDQVNGLFGANPDAGKELVAGADELFGSLARDPQAIPEMVANLNTSLSRLATTFNFGASRQMSWKLDISITPFQQYTATDCPHYGDVYGPRCGGPSVPEGAPPQEYPAQMLPRAVDSAAPAPTQLLPGVTVPGLPSLPSLPVLPGIPTIPGLPAIPGVTAPAAYSPSTPGQTNPAGLRGAAAVAAIVGGEPTVAQLLLLGAVLAGGTVHISTASEEGA